MGDKKPSRYLVICLRLIRLDKHDLNVWTNEGEEPCDLTWRQTMAFFPAGLSFPVPFSCTDLLFFLFSFLRKMHND